MQEAQIGHNSGEQHPATRLAADQLKAIIERIERLEEEKKTISDDIRDVYAEAKGNGFDVKALRTIVRMRKQDANERAEQETILETYLHCSWNDLMTRWFRFYTSVVDDPKAQMLAPDLFKHWVNLLCIAAENDGEFPALSAIAFKLRLPEAKAAAILAKLCSHGFLDKTEKGFRPHNWDSRQYKSDKTDNTNADRQKRFRDRQRNADSNANSNAKSNGVTSVTSKQPDTETDTETEVEKKETRASALPDDWPTDFREQFWKLYPNKVGKPKALAKLERVAKRAVHVPWAEIMDGLERYIRSKPPDRPWLNPETFINQERWADQPANTSDGHAATQNRPGGLIAAIDRQLARLEAEEGAPSTDFALPTNDFTAYRTDQYPDPDGYMVSLGAVLEQYPDDVVMYVSDPRTGIQRASNWPPTINEIVSALDTRVADLRRKERFENWGKNEPALIEPPRGERLSLDELKAKYGENWGLRSLNQKTTEVTAKQAPSWDEIANLYQSDPSRLKRLIGEE